MDDQTGATRRALDEMYPAQWDDPYVAFCTDCGRELDPTEAHSPHHPDCPQRTFGAPICACARSTCAACCDECSESGERAVAWLLALVLFVALLSIVWQGEPTSGSERAPCPDRFGACVYEP